MALLFPSLASTSSSSSAAASIGLPFPVFSAASSTHHSSRLQQKCFFSKTAAPVNNAGCGSPLVVAVNKKGMVCASAVDAGSIDLPSEEGAPSTSLENLPLESKLQERLEQKLKMKLAKKIRLRRKRLVRKRRMRKKGRWPPSKMKKNKNV